MTPPRIEARQLSLLLADRIEQVVEALAIDVRRRGRRKWVAHAPWCSHPRPKLEIELYPRPGKWNDWIGGKFGDAFDLVAACLGGGEKDRKAAYAWALDFLGLRTAHDPSAWAERAAEAQRRADAREAKAKRELGEARRTAQARWLHAHPLAAGDDAWRYLAARSVELAAFPRLPRAMRFSPAEPWYDDAGQVAHTGPAILSAMTLPDGKFGSLHRIWIDPGRPGEKADLDPPRKMWPDSEGACIRLWRGETGLSEADAFARNGRNETAIAGEGVEDGLSAALMAPELRVIAAGSLPGLLAMTPPRCVRRLIVLADNDWGKPQAQALLDRACRRLIDVCKVEVSLARSPEGKDFNDLLRGRA